MTRAAAQRLLANALERHGYDDWYTALLHAAIEETRDAAQAVKVADKIFAANPKDVSKPRPDDADALFSGKQDVPQRKDKR